MKCRTFAAACLAALLATPSPAPALTGPAAKATPGAEAPPAAPQSLVLLFPTGSSRVRSADEALLDQAARLYRDAHPIILVLTGSTDTVGPPEANLRLSQQRTLAVLSGLVARGIPASRFQLVAKGASEPSTPAPPGVSDELNRRVEIRWR